MNEKDLRQKLKDHSLRITDCRVAVLKYFYAQKHALSSRNLEERFSEYDRVTLFRTLNSFVDKGILHRIPSDMGAANYALYRDYCHSENHHHDHVHFACSKCGVVECIESTKVPKIEIPGYVIKDFNFIVSGICKNCITQ